MVNKKKLFNIDVDVKSAIPIYEQVKRSIKIAILSGRLAEGDRLMSLRELALKLQINPNTIIKVYYQLEVEGFIYSRPGAGYYVRVNRKQIKKEKRQLFETISNEYILKVLELDYSVEETVEYISGAAQRKRQNHGNKQTMDKEDVRN